MKKFKVLVGFIAWIFLLAISINVLGQEIPPRTLLDAARPNESKRLIPSSDQVIITPVSEADNTGVIITIKPGKDPFPGIKLRPDTGDVWNLSAYGHIEATLTNLGTKPLRLNLRADNATGAGNAFWDTESANIAPDKTEKITLIFGFGNGHLPAYPLKADAISMVLFFLGKAEEDRSFRIDSLIAGGPPNEKSILPADAITTKPVNGILLGADTQIDSGKQLEPIANAQATVEGNSLLLWFAQSKTAQSVKFKPTAGRWDLRLASQLRIKIKNEGTAPLTPSVQAASDYNFSTDKISAPAPLMPGAESEIILPFASALPWKGGPSSEKPGSIPAIQGTGNEFVSSRTASVTFSAVADGAAKLRVLSIIADSPVAQLPDWLGKRPPVPGDWSITFEDNFDGNEIDLKKWNNIGPNYWDKGSHWSKSNIIVGNGLVKMRYEKKTGAHNDDPAQKSTDYASGYLDTRGKFRQCYGYFESRMKLPTAQGLWPAFWTMPERGEKFGKLRGTTRNGGMEFDIMEYLAIWGPRRYNIAMHWDEYGPEHKNTGTKPYFEADKDGFITSGMLWLPGVAVFYCNGKEIGRWEDPRICSVPSYIMYTLPVGGWDNNFLDESALPDDFLIDYVRVWQRSDLMNPEDQLP